MLEYAPPLFLTRERVCDTMVLRQILEVTSVSKTKKKGFFRLSAAEYREYQDERERPRGAFAEIWEPDTQPVSLHRVRVESRAVYLADKGRKSAVSEDELFLRQD